jgi:peptidoglycan/xylan/chitin deacetylase (PgdA/CDA1 family)
VSSGQKVKIRHDDWDFRMSLNDYRQIHELFIEADLVETAVIQWTQHGNPSWKPDLIDYLKTAPNWDVQLHGWTHDPYKDKSYGEIMRDLVACVHMFEHLLERRPTIWFPPWNGNSPDMVKAAEFFGITISNESNDIAKFVREYDMGLYQWGSIYFHGWNRPERELIPEMIKRVSAIEKGEVPC